MNGEPAVVSMQPDHRPKVGLALGSGSARGWSHIGVIRALQAAGYAPDVVCGTSIGALVGAVHAAGYLDWLEAWVRKLDRDGIWKLMDFKISGGLLEGRHLVDFFRQRFNDEGIEKLPLPFACVATELQTGREIWLHEGSVIDAVRASIALPGLFTPAQYEGHVLVDGGLVNPVPVSLCRAMGADVVIAVDLNWDLIGRRASALQTQPNASMEVHAEPPPKAGFFSGWFGGDRNTPPAAPHADQAADRSMLSVLATSLNIMQVRITQSRLAGDPADVVIRPRLAGIGAMDFDHAAVAIEQGEAATRLVMPQIVDVIGTGNELNHPGNSGDSLV